MNALAAKPGKKRWWLWCVLLGAAGWLAMFGDKSPSGSVAAVSQPARAPPLIPSTSSLTGSGNAKIQQPLEGLAERDQLIAAASTAASAAAGSTAHRDLFSVRSWIAPPPPAPPAPAPVAPPLPFAYLGKKLEGQAWEVYLTRGEQTFIVGEGRTIESVWRVDKIAPPSMTMTFLPLDQAQTLIIGDTR